MFALDVFEGHQGFWKTTVALMMHLIPTGIVLLALAVSWRWEWVGAILFPACGLWHLLLTWGRFQWPVYLIIEGPLFNHRSAFPGRRSVSEANRSHGLAE